MMAKKDLVYVTLRKGKVAKTIEQYPDVFVDFDANGKVLGIECISALEERQRLSKAEQGRQDDKKGLPPFGRQGAKEAQDSSQDNFEEASSMGGITMRDEMPDPEDPIWRKDSCADLIPPGLYARDICFVYVISSEVRTETGPKEYGSRETVTKTWREYRYYDFEKQEVSSMWNGLMCDGNMFIPIKDKKIVEWAMRRMRFIAKQRKDAYLEMKPILDAL